MQGFKKINFVYEDTFSVEAFFDREGLDHLHIYVGSILNPEQRIEVSEYLDKHTDEGIEQMAREEWEESREKGERYE